MDTIGDIVKKVFGDISLKTIEEQKKIEEVFEKVSKNNRICGAAIAGFKDGQLTVHVGSSAQLYQVSRIKAKLLAELSALSPEIRAITFKIGKV